ncbi:G2/mitotic-specific cyclin [Dinochytrium kinnereticum]|nr:G2/mitotic-specific cyclin [Dinochytrium kinnereticum]
MKKTTQNDENAAPALIKGGKELRSHKDVDAHPGKQPLHTKHAAPTAAAAKKERTALNTLSVHNVQVQPANNTTKVVKKGTAKSQVVGKKNLAEVARTRQAAEAVTKSPKQAATKDDAENSRPNETLPEPKGSRVVRKEAANVKASKVVEKGAEPRTRAAKAAAAAHVVVPVEADEVSDKQSEVAPAEEEADWDDLDAQDAMDPMMVSEYVVEIFEYMKELEVATMPNPNYMDSQKELQWKMRAILVDWLIEVHHKFRLLPETLYMSVNIIDRFLSLRVVSLVKLQLVGVTAMFIASKYEEVVPPSVKNFIYMADNGYTDEEILKAERYVLAVLDFNLQYPSPMSFLRRCSKAEHYDIQTRTLAKYLMEISLVDHRFLDVAPSQVAGAGLYLARKMLRRGAWDKNLVHYSGYTEAELSKCVGLMLDYLERPLKYEALFKKYASKKFMRASVYVKEWMEKRRKMNLGYAEDGSDREDYLL